MVPDADCGFQVEALAFGSKLSRVLLNVLMFTRWCLIFLISRSSRLPFMAETNIWCYLASRPYQLAFSYE